MFFIPIGIFASLVMGTLSSGGKTQVWYLHILSLIPPNAIRQNGDVCVGHCCPTVSNTRRRLPQTAAHSLAFLMDSLYICEIASVSWRVQNERCCQFEMKVKESVGGRVQVNGRGKGSLSSPVWELPFDAFRGLLNLAIISKPVIRPSDWNPSITLHNLSATAWW